MAKGIALATAVGFLLGCSVVFWVRPDTDAGAAFIVVVGMLLCLVAQALFLAIRTKLNNRNRAAS
jgi:hypothetical protein